MSTERYLTFALGKGRLANKTLELLEQLGITCEEMKDKNTELLMKEEDRSVEFYIDYGKRTLAGGLLYLQNTSQIRMFNLQTGEQKIIKSRD